MSADALDAFERSLGSEMQDLREALEKACKPKDFQAIADKLMERAKGGDTVAAKIVLDLLLGEPEQPVTTKETDDE